MIEIERKFTVDAEKWGNTPKSEPKRIVQGYILRDSEKTIRVRTIENRGYLTIKGKTIGIARSEFEYEIPYQEATELLERCVDKVLTKDRYEVRSNHHLWEVDEFRGQLDGLIIAELELKHENESFEIPDWVIEDVSLDPQYYNASLIDKL